MNFQIVIILVFAICTKSAFGRKRPMILGKFPTVCPYGPDGPFCGKEPYFNHLPPNFMSNESLAVNVSLVVKGLSKIDSFEKEFTLLIHVTFAWEDHRIEWNENFSFPDDQDLIFEIQHLQKLWVPDALFKNSMQSEKPRAIPLEIYDEKFFARKDTKTKRGVFYYASSVLVKTHCNMKFGDFPFDTQSCPVLLTSLRNQEDILWEIDQFDKGEENFHDAEFQCSIDNVTVGAKHAVGFYFHMKRVHNVYMYTYFGPCMLMVITSWISFTVNFDAVPGRLGLLLTLLLMMINLNNSVSSTIPKSSNVTPITIWIVGSIAFVFLALLEYAIILYIVKFVEVKKILKTKPVKKICETEDKLAQLTLYMDRIALAVFPAVYVLFVIVYYLTI